MSTLNLGPKQRKILADYLKRHNLPKAEELHGTPHPENTPYLRYGKRAADIFIAGTALIVTAPINIALAVGTFVDVGHPIIFKQERVGKDGKIFTLYKFRNMTNDTDENGNLLPPEQRVTKWGRFVRRTSLDELLNFWSILRGDMSLIGPRPLIPEYTERYCAFHRARLAVKPGLECPPRPGAEDASTWEGEFNNAAWYAANVSFATDLRKCARLFEAVFNSRSNSVRGDAGRSYFMGYDENGYAISLGDLSDELITSVLEGEEA